jgi:hypothetical protein
MEVYVWKNKVIYTVRINIKNDLHFLRDGSWLTGIFDPTKVYLYYRDKLLTSKDMKETAVSQSKKKKILPNIKISFSN